MKRNYIKQGFWVMLLMLGMAACGKSAVDEVVPDPEEPEVPNPPTPDPVNFYYVGYKYGSSFQEKDRNAILRINNSLVELSPNVASEALAVSVLNKVPHITGYQQVNANNKRAAYWKNKALTLLSVAGAQNSGTTILAEGANVYVGGMMTDPMGLRVALWTNGKYENKGCCLGGSRLRSIALREGKPVMTGKYHVNAAMWVDGSTLMLADPNSDSHYIKTINNDIYVIGYRKTADQATDVAAVWKNDVEIFTLPLGKIVSSVLGTMVGNDYYFVVNFYDGKKGRATVYKNKTKLYDLNVNANLEAKAIQVVNGHVYILGNYFNGTKSQAIQWTDGKAKVLYTEAQKIYLNDMVVK